MFDAFTLRLLGYISSVVWLFPPVRQYKTRVFWFFLILALTDPIALTLGRQLGVFTTQFYIISFTLLPISLSPLKKVNRKNIIFVVLLFATGILTLIFPWHLSSLYYCIISVLLLLIFLKIIFSIIAETGKLNLFYMVLIMYQSSMLLRSFMFLINLTTGLTYGGITVLFQIIIAIFFSIFKEDDPRLLINLRKE